MPAPAPKKDALTKMAFGKPKPSGDDEPDTFGASDGEDAVEEADEGLSAACDEVFDAVKNDDREGFSAAFTSAVRLAREE